MRETGLLSSCGACRIWKTDPAGQCRVNWVIIGDASESAYPEVGMNT